MKVSEFASFVCEQTGRIILGKRTQTELLLVAMLSGGHVLIDDLPGVGKTTLVKAFSKVSGCTARRIQFVPDLLPADITGMNIFDRRDSSFHLVKGPVFCNILLADEINRALPRTQSALLEAMEEKNVTIDGETMCLPTPFMVLATQNPVESESTFRLPAAQMDRFMIRMSMGYPSAEEEKRMLLNEQLAVSFNDIQPVSDPEMIKELKKNVAEVTVTEHVMEYIVAITTATRENKSVLMGAGPRATKALFNAAKALAAIRARKYVTPDDVKYLAPYVLTHRLILAPEARVSGQNAEDIISSVLENITVPPVQKKIFDE